MGKRIRSGMRKRANRIGDAAAARPLEAQSGVAIAQPTHRRRAAPVASPGRKAAKLALSWRISDREKARAGR